MFQPEAAYRNPPQSKSAVPRLTLEPQTVPPPARFDAAFIERRMQVRHAWQEYQEYEMACEIARKVEGAILQKLAIAREAAKQLKVAR